MTAWSSSTRRRRLPLGWSSTIVPRILARDGYRCRWVEAGRRCDERAAEIDHIDGTDDHRDANLQALCEPHHRRKTQAQATAARWRLRARRPAEQHPGKRGGG